MTPSWRIRARPSCQVLVVVEYGPSAAQQFVGMQGPWPPALAFEGFEAGMKGSVGNLLGDSQRA